MTDALATHREANANAADDLAARIKQANVEFIYYQFVSINGRVLAKVVPAAHLKRSLDKGVQFHGSAIADVAADRHGELFGGGIAAEEFAVMPDADSFQVRRCPPTSAASCAEPSMGSRRALGTSCAVAPSPR